jgi:PAS domain S-box-containing protein
MAVATQWLGWLVPSVAARDLLDRIEFIYLGLLFLIGAAVMAQSYRRATSVVLKQQMKWITRGTFLSVAPFLVFYIIPYFMGWPIRPWMKLTALSLILLPLTFGYAIVRYRLMDVDIIFKRGVAYTLATAAIVALYFGVIAGLGALFQTSVQGGPWSAIIAIMIGAVLFQPVRDWFQARIDRFFYRDRYDYRGTLIEFGRALSSEVHLERMLGSVLDRLSQTLLVDRMAIFLPRRENGQGFRLIRSLGLNYSEPLDLSFLSANGAPDRGYLFSESLRNDDALSAEARRSLDELDLHYYIPCRLQKRTVAFLGLGKTVDGDFLSTEDIELLQTMAGYVAIAVENAELYQSLEQKAHQIEQLKDFSENIIESVNVGLLAIDLEGCIESWNPRMEQLYGLSRAEAVGRQLEEVFPADLVKELALRQDGSALADRTPDPSAHATTLYKFYLQSRRNEQLVVNIGLAPLRDKTGQVEGRLIILDDISERVQFEQQLMQAEKLTSIGLLAAGVAHEVNTPLAVISNYVQMLAKQMDGNDARLKLIEKIVQQTFRASEIVNNLLSFSRTSGTQLTDVDLNRVIEDTLLLLDHQFKTSRINVLTALESELPAIQGNTGKLQQVFLNLFLNAKDAMPQGGVLEVRTLSRDSIVEIEVADSGMGIPREHLHKIFDPFFTTKSNFRGTGLGLAVSYGIVREHCGKIDVSSTPGRGTAFRLEFPVSRKAVRV